MTFLHGRFPYNNGITSNKMAQYALDIKGSQLPSCRNTFYGRINIVVKVGYLNSVISPSRKNYSHVSGSAL